jgi:hypothetical protein
VIDAQQVRDGVYYTVTHVLYELAHLLLFAVAY